MFTAVIRKRKVDDELTPRIDAFLAKAASQKRPKTASVNDETPPTSPPPPPGLLMKAVSTEVAFSLAECRKAAEVRRPERLPEDRVVGALDEARLVRTLLLPSVYSGGELNLNSAKSHFK